MTKLKYLGIISGLIIIFLATMSVRFFMQKQPDSALINNFQLEKSIVSNKNSVTIDINDALIGAYITLILDGKHYKTIKADSSKLTISDIPVNEGENSINVSQEVKSFFGEKISDKKMINVLVDTIPPDADVEIIGNYPELTNQEKISVKYRITGNEVVKVKLANATSEIVEGFDERSINLHLKEGNNYLTFSLFDAADNEKITDKTLNISLDKTTPKITTSLCSSAIGLFQPNDTYGNDYEEKVCLSMGQFYGPLTGTAHAPITGKVQGNITSVSFDGKTLNVKDDLSINQTVPVFVRHGSNNYEVKVVDKAGNVSTTLYPLTWSSDEELARDTDDEILDRIDDLESQIDDIR